MAGERESNDSPWMLPVVVAGAMCAIFMLLWMIYTRQIVQHGVVIFHYVDESWNWIPLNVVRAYNFDLERRYAIAYSMGSDAPFLSWMRLSTDVFRPFAVLMTLPAFLAIARVWLGPRLDLRRRFKGDDLVVEIMKNFSGVAPVAKLNLINSTNPLWRPQMWPEELVKEYVLARDNTVVAERARRYFAQTLGPRVVDLQGADGKNPTEICFADRLSPTGKVVYALLCAFAFGGEAGRKQAWKVMDLLNYSAYGTPNGEANLSVAGPLYQQYRMQKEAHALFRVHHYENTYLFELFKRAKRWGRINTPHFRWLRPMDRYKYLALNTVLRFVPHPEAAAVFNLHAFERACFKQGRIPKSVQPQSEAGKYPEPGLPYVEDAVEALTSEYASWLQRRDLDGEERIWANKDLWKISNPNYNPAPSAPPPVEPGPETQFDTSMKAEDEAADARRRDRLDAEISMFGTGSGSGFNI